MTSRRAPARLAAAAGTYDAVVALPLDGSGETAVGVLRAEGEHIAGVRRIAYEARRDVTGAWKLAAMEEKACFSAKNHLQMPLDWELMSTSRPVSWLWISEQIQQRFPSCH